MNRHDAECTAKKFLASYYPELSNWNFAIDVEQNNHGSWSFSVCPDEEDPDFIRCHGMTGYVNRQGTIEGLY